MSGSTEIVSEWNSVEEKAAWVIVCHCQYCHMSSVVRQTWQTCSFLRRDRGSSELFGIRTLPLTASMVFDGGQLLRHLTLSVPVSIAKVHSGCKSDGNASSKYLPGKITEVASGFNIYACVRRTRLGESDGEVP